jgi:hypothetical protein
MPMFFRVLSTECLKLKRTLALWMVLVTPMVVIALQFFVAYHNAPLTIRLGKDVWTPMVRQTVQAWTLLMLPLFVTLETSLLAGLENAGNNWKSLLALPAPRWTIYFSKLTVTICLLWAAHAVLVGGTIAGGMLLKLLRPGINLAGMPLGLFVPPMVTVSLCALLGVTIQHWVSLRWHSYPVALGFGMCAMITGVFAAQSENFAPWFPWSLPMAAVMTKVAAGVSVERIAIWAIVGAVVAACAGCQEFVRREIS